MSTSQPQLKMYIDGKWVESESGKYFAAQNPATLETIAYVPEGTREDARRAIAAARKNKNAIASMSIWERSHLCRAIADVMERRQQELARVLSEDQGKPLYAEALFEVKTATEGFREASEQIRPRRPLPKPKFPLFRASQRRSNLFRPFRSLVNLKFQICNLKFPLINFPRILPI